MKVVFILLLGYLVTCNAWTRVLTASESDDEEEDSDGGEDEDSDDVSDDDEESEDDDDNDEKDWHEWKVTGCRFSDECKEILFTQEMRTRECPTDDCDEKDLREFRQTLCFELPEWKCCNEQREETW